MIIQDFNQIAWTLNRQHIAMPKGAEPLSITARHDGPVIHAIVDPEQLTFQVRKIVMLTSNIGIDPKTIEGFSFLGSVQSYSYDRTSGIVWHVWIEALR